MMLMVDILQAGTAYNDKYLLTLAYRKRWNVSFWKIIDLKFPNHSVAWKIKKDFSGIKIISDLKKLRLGFRLQVNKILEQDYSIYLSIILIQIHNILLGNSYIIAQP
jgi:hypothetical protein